MASKKSGKGKKSGKTTVRKHTGRHKPGHKKAMLRVKRVKKAKPFFKRKKLLKSQKFSKKGLKKIKIKAKLSAKKRKALQERKKKKEVREREALELLAKKEAYEQELERINNILTHSFARQALVNLAGENSLEIIKSFDTNLSDEDIAKKLKLKISDVRATLNKLHGEGLVAYFRDKNNETGWYSYTWTANSGRIEKWVDAKINEIRLSGIWNGAEQYFCPSCGSNSIHDFEAAVESSFKCQNCNKNLEFLDEEKRNELIFGRKNGRV